MDNLVRLRLTEAEGVQLAVAVSAWLRAHAEGLMLNPLAGRWIKVWRGGPLGTRSADGIVTSSEGSMNTLLPCDNLSQVFLL